MGTIRFLLALSVIAAHSGLNAGLGGRNSVQAFFLISGFLISYVLTESNRYATLRKFYTSRFLRIYPLYFVVAALSLVFQVSLSLANKPAVVISTLMNAPPDAKVLLTVSNAVIFFQDWVMFSGVKDNHVVFSSDFTQSEVPLWLGLLVPQAWSLGLELTFYLFAPFILRSKPHMVTVFTLGVLIRVILMLVGLGFSDPWSYRFFPAEISLFLAGAFVHQVLLPRFRVLSATRARIFSHVAISASVASLVLYSLVPLPELTKTAMVALILLFSLPPLFEFQAKHSFDYRLAQLSYPVYLWHLLVIQVIQVVQESSNHPVLSLSLWRQVSVVGISSGLALLSNRLLDSRIERIRASLRK
jgi:peptidoglycan/LPS O-acetylase OafA/YrhL